MELKPEQNYGADKLRSYTRVSYVLLKCVGAVPFSTRWTPVTNVKRFRLIWLYFFSNQILLMAGEHITIWTSITDPKYFKESVSLLLYFIYGLLGMCKSGWIMFHHQKMSKIINDLEPLYPTTKDEQNKFQDEVYSKKIILRMRYYGIIQVAIMWCFCLFPLVNVAVNKITGKEMKEMEFPLGDIYVPVDKNSFKFLPFVYFMHVCAINFSQMSLSASDLLLLGLILQICTHFDYLNTKLNEIKPDDINQKESYDKLSFCLKRHSDLIDISQELDEVFSPTVLQNFFSSSLVLCMLGFLIATSIGTPESMKYNIHTLASPIIQTFVICWLGEKIKEHSLRVADAAYDNQWYHAELKYKKSICVMMTRAQSPQFISAYKFSVSSLPTFSGILSTSWSYLMLLLTLYKE